ncbi:metallophosphoesterase family protein [Paenibacillus sp. NEAU-GSW1]|uniref:purple acid phosphatase family protein n=1 Tax=Paenibacillus sp. NEAU-GSW1 TaxID=2682486 RepID=UPI0012E1B42A|nr:metallophosphoesterase family protein [Paenibacillus sp. NEAU-GSW1]MUT66915.1 metallophosphoesterase [Paenibacillus sp. NEAU-GSW1]
MLINRKIITFGIAAVCLALAGAIIWLENADAVKADKPISIVTTIKSDPATSRAFTWHTRWAGLETVVQLVKGNEPTFENSNEVLMFYGQSSEVRIEKGSIRGVHRAEATGLKPGTEYTYRVGDGKEGGWSKAATFRTASALSANEAVTFINVTDSQGTTRHDFKLWGNTLNKAFQLFPDAAFIVHNGDLTEDPIREESWTAFFEQPQKWLTSVPLMPVTGNHDEVDGDSSIFSSHFNVPANGAEGSNEGTTYSFDYGNVHFVMLNTESNIKGQTEWLRQNLSRSDKQWTIVSIHRGAYGGNMYKKIKEWVKIFDEYGVDLVLQGHNHEYSRSFPLRGGDIVRDGEGTVYVTTNASGPKLNEKKEDQFYHRAHFQKGKPMFAGITVKDDTLSFKAYDIDGGLLDQFTLKH